MRGVQFLTLCLLSVSFGVSLAAPADKHEIKKRVNNLPVIPAGDDDVTALTQLKNKRWKLVPVKVEQIESYEGKNAVKAEPSVAGEDKTQDTTQKKRSHTFRELSRTHEEYSNHNGNVQSHREDSAQASEDGQLLSSFRHKGDALARPGEAPHYKTMTEMDVPWLNIHDQVVNTDGDKAYNTVNMEELEKTSDEAERTIRSLVEYIEETGDDATVASFLESLVKEDKMSESEALAYVEGIEDMLEKDKEIEEILRAKISEVEKEEEREDEAELILNLSDFLDLKYKSGKINKQAYDDLKGRLMETVMDIAREDPYFLSLPNGEN